MITNEKTELILYWQLLAKWVGCVLLFIEGETFTRRAFAKATSKCSILKFSLLLNQDFPVKLEPTPPQRFVCDDWVFVNMFLVKILWVVCGLNDMCPYLDNAIESRDSVDLSSLSE